MKNWNHIENSIGSIDLIPVLANMNIGLVHAYCTPTATCAIDVDDLQNSKKWLKKEGINLDTLANEENAVVVSSGKPNSLKIIYRLPHRTTALVSQQIKGPSGSMMIEFRCGTRDGRSMHDLIPPSMHPSGSFYSWSGRGDPFNIPTIPDLLLDLWKRVESDRSRNTRCPSKLNHQPCLLGAIKSTRAETPRAIAELEAMLKHIDSNCDYCTWRNIVWGVLSTNWHTAIPIARKWSATASDRYSESAFNELVRSFDVNLKDRPTLGTILFHARQGGWRG